MKTAKTNGSRLPRSIRTDVSAMRVASDKFAERLEQAANEGQDIEEMLQKISPTPSLRWFPKRVRRLAAEQKASRCRVPVTVNLGLHEYGALCAGAKLHGLTIEEMLATYIEERFCDWSNDGFPIDHVEG